MLSCPLNRMSRYGINLLRPHSGTPAYVSSPVVPYVSWRGRPGSVSSRVRENDQPTTDRRGRFEPLLWARFGVGPGSEPVDRLRKRWERRERAAVHHLDISLVRTDTSAGRTEPEVIASGISRTDAFRFRFQSIHPMWRYGISPFGSLELVPRGRRGAGSVLVPVHPAFYGSMARWSLAAV